jgi:long-chain fatty acid transport protein
LAAPATVELNGSDAGYRLGLAYEIPDIAFRGQLLYRSGTTHTPDGTGVIGGSASSASGYGKIPQIVEARLQTGIAPGWLAFGSVKWTDWSVNRTLDLNALGGARQNEYYWRDGWTISGGVGHSFNEKVSGSVTLSWDRGVTTGHDLMSDTYTMAIGGSYKDDLVGEFRGGIGLARLTSATETEKGALNTSVDAGWAVAVNASYRFTW